MSEIEFFEATPTLRFPAIHSPVYKTPNGVSYLKSPGVVAIGFTVANLAGIKPFLEGFDESLGYSEYLKDPTKLPSPETLSKFAGQLCYMALGEKRSSNADASKYFENIKKQYHGSVVEHPNISVLLYGLSRSQTHELVRHRAGFGYSQLSQRYVMGKMLRFVERPEFQDDAELHERFIRRVEFLSNEYEEIARILFERQQAGSKILRGEAKTELKKKVNQAARAALPNETEAPVVVTGNVRAWRHFFEMRAASGADVEIRGTAFPIFLCIREISPILFEDYKIKDLPDGTKAVETTFRKV